MYGISSLVCFEHVLWPEWVKSDVTMTPRSPHELTYGREAASMDIGVVGTVFPMQSVQLYRNR